ncbi:hypothetical protein PAE9249_03645 [Paenibacillus sp. CECT 9249]|uniref:ThiF family adenylyltransferase n=1 Tax=Paenibacillus sp. CECT 9249 TaxID=2845385 RepID=UPI001E4607E3|nr:ThiF family adenylyltransferase [Paenibacillus sp. CECT 9249]CAH0121119.1 hypothetical protein PAE9249_03645 [Paenibacillus sp. CECT 9249]
MNNRYSRQRLFKPIGDEGQRKLEKAAVAVIGCGALGSAIAETLARAGVGHLHLVDRDVVEPSNLQRQQLFHERHAEEAVPKVAAAAQRLREIRSDMQLSLYMDHADGIVIEQLASKCDLLMDAADNFETRFLINDAAYKYNRPWIYGACAGGAGAVFPFVPGTSACLSCLLPALPSFNDTCDTAGIIGPAAQTTAALQCAEALKWLTGNGQALMKKVHHFDLWSNTRLDIGIGRIKRTDCPTCGERPSYPALSTTSQMKCTLLCGRDTVQIIPDRQRIVALDAVEQAERLADAIVRRTPYFLELQIGEHRIILFENGRVLIHGLKDVHQGRKLYRQLFG